MRSLLRAVLAAGLLVACGHEPIQVRSEAPEPRFEPPFPIASPSALPERPPGEVVGTVGPTVTYSCEGIEAVVPTAATSHPLTRQLLDLAPVGSNRASGKAEAIAAALAELASTAPADLSTRDRILLQASLTRIAKLGGRTGRKAAVLVQHVALDPAVASSLGSDPRHELEPWVGPSEGWVERRGPSCGPLGAHDGAYAGELAFRTLRSGSRRVIFAQVVAFDTAWQPHVTPVVALVELRNGMAADAPACVIEATAEGLEATKFDSLHVSPFVQPTPDGRVGCGNCHHGQGPHDLADLGREEGGAFRVERRLALLERAGARGVELRALGGER